MHSGLKQLEDKLSRRMADSVEQLAEIIKDYARKSRRLGERVGEVELKIFGHSKEEKERKPKNAGRNAAAAKNAANPNNSSMLKNNSLMSNSLLGNKENSFSKANKQSKKAGKDNRDHSPPV